MASKLFSKILPPGSGESIYETLRQNEESSDQSDIEERAGMALDEENLREGFNDYELDRVLTNADLGSTPSSKIEGSELIGGQRTARARVRRASAQSRLPQKRVGMEDLDDDVPQSLLFEGDRPQVTAPREQGLSSLPAPVSAPEISDRRPKWQAAQEHQRLRLGVDMLQSPQLENPPRKVNAAGVAHPREKAMWRWANVENLDNFLKDVYDYFLGNGIWCILLSRALNLLSVLCTLSLINDHRLMYLGPWPSLSDLLPS